MAVLAHISDLHLRPPGVLTLGTIDADRYTAAAIDAVNRRHPDVDAVIVSGDVADLGEDDAYTRAAMLLLRFSAPVIVMPGNHDATGNLREAFAAFPGLGAEPVPGKACHVHRIADVTVVALDTSVDDIANSTHHGEVGAAQLEWLGNALEGAGPTVIAMHHPPFDVGIGFMDDIGLTDRDAFAAVLARHRNVVRIVCGHVHRTIVGDVAGVPTMAIPGVAHQVMLALEEGAPVGLVMEPPAYAVHTVTAHGAVSHVGYVNEFDAAVRVGSEAA
ncbi:phosphodiesterase [Acuticoccus sp.]|uniref:phosphodiesterase n=1 Tax=Acuticoccus sp. TaxID=1904378 RepID=UPI003B52CA7F